MRDAERLLRESLFARAGEVGPGSDPYARTAAAIRRSHRVRLLVTTVCVVVLLGAAVPVAIFRPFRDTPLEGWEVRGSLAGNSAVLETLRHKARSALPVQEDAGEAVRYVRVLYAGDDGSATRAVVVVSMDVSEGGSGRPRREWTVDVLVFLQGPSGARTVRPRASKLLSVESGRWLGPEPPSVPYLTWIDNRQEGESTLFVFGPPQTRAIAYSPRPKFHSDGTWSRSWRRLSVRDGVAVARIPESFGRASLVRLRLPGETGVVRPKYGRFEEPLDARSWPEIAGLHERLRGRTPPPKIRTVLDWLRVATGVPMDRFDVRAVWNRDAQVHLGVEESWLLAGTLPSGATFQLVALPREEAVLLAPRGEADRPVAVAEPSFPWGAELAEVPTPRVVVITPGRSDGRVQLRHKGHTVATTRIDGSQRAVFRERTVPPAVRSGEEPLRFRVFSDDGEELHSGTVRTRPLPRWNRERGFDG